MVVGFLTAETLAARVTSGDLDAASAVAEAVGRSRASEALNAFTLLDEAGALTRAAGLEGRRTGPLLGVPVAVKDLIDQAGLPTTCGSSFYREVPSHSAAVVDRLEAAGAVIVGRTGLHEFAFGFSSENPWWGPVRNPWDPETSAGGSSGGSAAAVAAGIVPVALGTDTGGSVRVPAALCGIVGLKPTHGRVPLTGVYPLAPSLDTVGPITRTVGDASLAYRVVAGDDPDDPWSAARAVEAPRPPRPLAGLRIAVPHPWVDRPCDPVVAAGFFWVLDALAEAGAVVHHLHLPQLDPPGLVADSLGPEAALVHGRRASEHPECYGPDVLERIRRAAHVDAGRFAEALAWRARIRNALLRALDGHDVVATPTTAVHLKRLGIDTVDTAAGPEPHLQALSWFTAPVNHAGLPAIALPLASPGSPPPSLQLIGRAWGEAELLAAAQSLEAAGLLSGEAPRARP